MSRSGARLFLLLTKVVCVMSAVISAPVGRWSGSVTYANKVDEYTVAFDENGFAQLTTPDSTGHGKWSATGADTFEFTIREEFTRDANGATTKQLLPGAAYIEIDITARRDGTTFAGAGTARVCATDGTVIHSTAARTTARQVVTD